MTSPGTETSRRSGPASSPAPLATRPGAVLAVVVAAWAAVPALVAPPKLTWAVLAVLLALVLAALWRNQRTVRWTTPVTLVTVVLLCATVSSVHHGTLPELVPGAATAALLVGCTLLAVACGPDDVRLLARGLVLLALVELAVAMVTSATGLPSPWGYLGGPAPAYDANELVPALGGRSTGTTAHPIPFGTLMAVAAALCLTRATRWPVLVRALAGAAACYGLALSGSRSAAVVLCAATLVAVLTPGALRIGTAARIATVLLTGILALRLQDATLAIYSSLEGTGSLTHRLAALDAAGRLLDRPFAQTFLGSGTGSLDDLFDAGLLQLDGFFAVDNQLVATFAVAGLVGLAALCAALLLGLLRGDPQVRPAALVLLGMLLSFDLLEWNATAVLLLAVVTLGSGVARPARPGRGAAVPRPPAALPVGVA
ncbi:hypothetical protein [Blastococcus sp. SYSU D01042]